MARLADSRLSTAYMAGSTAEAWDLKYGGQQGWAPNVAQFLNNQAHKTPQLCCIVLEVPRVLRMIPGGDKYTESIKAMMEIHSLTITGFNEQLNVDVDQHAVGGAGAMQQEVVNVTREQPTPTHTFVEKEGRPIQKLLNWWIRYLLMDPESKFPLAPIVGNSGIKDMGADMYTMSCLYFAPNMAFNGVDRAWIVVNMFPMTDGDGSAQRDLTQGLQILNLDIAFTGLAQVGYGPQQLALSFMKRIKTLHADNYFREAAVSDESADVKAFTYSSYQTSVEDVGRESIHDKMNV